MNRRHLIPRLLRLLPVALLLVAAPAAATHEISQDFLLQPGWNAVFLEVQPAVNDTATVFAALPVESVWTWAPNPSQVEYISDPSEPRLLSTGWLGFYPQARPEAFLTNLFRVHANRPYLIKLGGGSPVLWTVTGRPAYRAPNWVPNSFNLVGGYVDPAAPPTFAQYFAPSNAHAGQPIYRLDPSGVWQVIPDSTQMVSGESFWIYTASSSDFAGPMHVQVAAGDGVDFGAVLTESDVTLINRSSAPAALTAQLLTAGPISYREFVSDDSDLVWFDLAPDAVVTAQAGQRRVLRLAVRRAELVGDEFDSIIRLTDGAGSRRLLPLRALQFGVVEVSEGSSLVVKRNKSGNPLAGLWVGTVTLDMVSSLPEATPGGTAAPPRKDTVSSQFDLRLLIHVDESGDARLLKEVIQMWEDGPTEGADGHYVLVTLDTLITAFEGSALADGEQVGRRVSTAAFDFDEASSPSWEAASQTLLLTGGTFGDGGSSLDTTITLPASHPSNPFYHRYHPDHGQNDVVLTRAITLTFDSDDPTLGPAAGANPDWGVTRVAGEYLETINGLHRLPLEVSGSFSLRRIADQGVLNQ